MKANISAQPPGFDQDNFHLDKIGINVQIVVKTIQRRPGIG
jgi:hypothetical protein